MWVILILLLLLVFLNILNLILINKILKNQEKLNENYKVAFKSLIDLIEILNEKIKDLSQFLYSKTKEIK